MQSDIKLAVVLGSGLGDYFGNLPRTNIISEDNVGIHKKVVFTSEIEGKNVLFFSGRKHFYEGYPQNEIAANMEIASSYGVKNIIITNAAGGINEDFQIGDLMLIKSHLNLNQNLVFEKTHFPYSKKLSGFIESVCRKGSIGLHEGVYCCSHGPMYESKAEIRMLKKFGCDAVGMSTVPESFAAKGLGINVAAISVITNLLRENDLNPPSHHHVLEAASSASPVLYDLIKNLLNELN